MKPRLLEAVEVKTGFYAISSPFKHLTVQPQGAAEVVLDVSDRKLYGYYTSRLINTGLTPLFRLKADSNAFFYANGDWIQAYQDFNLSQFVLRPGYYRDYQVRWVIADKPLDILWALIDIFRSGKVHVKESVLASALRYRANLQSVAEIPVSGVHIQW